MATPKGNEQSGGVNDFTIVSSFKNGYRNREDITVLPPGVLVQGSQNVLTNTHQRVGIRKGYTLYGQANTDLAPIGGSKGAMGVFDWTTSAAFDRHMRTGFLTSAGNDGKLQAVYEHDDGEIEWVDLLTGLTSVDYNYTTFWNNSVELLQVLMVSGEANIVEWFGGMTTLLSSTNTAGIVASITSPVNPSNLPGTDSGGVNYTVGDRLTIAAGNNDAVVEVLTTVAGAVNSTSIGNAGTGYAINDLVTISGDGDPPHCLLQITSVGGSGEVTGYTIIANGFAYGTGMGVTTSGGGGSGFTVNVLSVGLGIATWAFTSDADHGTGYSAADYVPMTGGTGTNAHIEINSVVSGTITKSGTETWGQSGFLVGRSPAKQRVTINGNVYTYGFGAFQSFLGDTTTLYGVTPNPTGEPIGSVIAQTPYVNVNGTDNNLSPNFQQSLIGVLEQRVFLGMARPGSTTGLAYSVIFVSQVNSYSVYGVGTSGVVGAPFEITTTSYPTAFIPQDQFMHISAGHDEWYNVSFTLSADLMTESVNINRLNTTNQQAAQTQAVTSKEQNSIVYLSFEPIINTFGPVQNILNNVPQITDLSFPIVNDMDAYDFTNASVFYFRKFIYVAVPRESLVLIYNMTDVKNPYWEAPQVMPINRFSIIGGELYGHSSLVSESYKLFDGTNDNGFPILAQATFSFNNYGTRSQSKGYNEFYVEGYISNNTELTLGVQYDIDGCATKTEFPIVGDDTQIVCLIKDQASLGKVPLGKEPLGGQILLASDTQTPKFRVIKTFPIRYFYEDQISFSSEGIDEQWELIAFGPQLLSGGSLNNNITQ